MKTQVNLQTCIDFTYMNDPNICPEIAFCQKKNKYRSTASLNLSKTFECNANLLIVSIIL